MVNTFESRFSSRSTPPPELPPFKYASRFDKPVFGDWRDELAQQGYTVVKGAVPTEKALQYREKAFEWLESFPLGFKRDDPKTWTNDCLPVHVKGGMFHSYGFCHEKYLWDLRCEPGIIDAFAKVWGTDELITSFDGGSIMLPKRTDVPDGGKWEHMDQSHHRKGFYCCQGLVNLNHCGPEDGGLMVLEGSNKLVEEFFDTHGRESYKTWGPFDWYGFTAEQQQWFFDRGCKWIKVCAEPGDLIMWDSRTMHYNVRPSGERDRVCTYICMAPAALLTEEDRQTRIACYEEFHGTTHVPFAAIFSRKFEPVHRADGKPCPHDTGKPRIPPVETPTLRKLVGIDAY
ncbi:hypothetical protein CI109_104422 [Kwoniella shandongensis]|uniref:Uncharacterized protein n=1 Tax=Kwoniella shandongensis TaxID=1734106 RepID=A0A5M6BWU6_9TREE|nr:uncharacterized protein CI109_004180 [Kwoniella shandongensis]KAA5527368.1 hypothetical protein CI109_004180 [Kwoniella shandongensis]